MSTSPLEWERLFSKQYCPDCGESLNFDGECNECKEGNSYTISEWST